MLTGKGLAHVLLAQVETRWETFTPGQQAECERILERLAATLRAAKPASPRHARVPLVGRIVA